MESEQFSYHFQKQVYENLTFFDKYGSSFIFFVLITVFLVILCFFSFAYFNASALKANWNENRCKPTVIPFAGIIMQPTDMSISEYTSQNFDFCMQQNVKSVAGPALQPLSFITNSLTKIADLALNGLNALRAMTYKMRDSIATIFAEIYQRLVNVIIPLQQIIIKTKDSFGKLQGVMVTSLYTFLGAYYGLESLMGVIAQVLVNILIALAAVILVLWLTPFTWGTAAAGTALFTAISIPLVILITFLRNAFQMDVKFGNLKVPSPKKLKCFDKNTKIRMHDGTEKSICDIKPGDQLDNNDEVNSVFKLATKGSIMYNVNGVIVSDSHLVYDSFKKKWVRVKNHFSASLVESYKEPYLYCLNTKSGSITINNILFSDWDEFSHKKRENIKKVAVQQNSNSKENWLHETCENGFMSNTLVALKDGSMIPIVDVKVGDELSNGSTVYGTVVINGINTDQYNYTKNGVYNFQGSSNICFCNEQNYSIDSTLNSFSLSKEFINPLKRENTLYNILTTNNWFVSSNCIFGDYNMATDCI